MMTNISPQQTQEYKPLGLRNTGLTKKIKKDKITLHLEGLRTGKQA
jgi:hypothetical protein